MRVFYIGSDGKEEYIVGDKYSKYALRDVLRHAAKDGVLRVGNQFIPWSKVVRVEGD